MRSIYDWQKLKAKFIMGDWLTVSEFLRETGIPNTSRSRTNTKGWRVERHNYIDQQIERAKQKKVEHEADIRLRQQTVAKGLQAKGIERLRQIPSENLSSAEAIRLIRYGLQAENQAMGMNELSVNRRNHSLFAQKSPLAEEINQFDMDTIVQLLNAVKKEKNRRLCMVR